jgi:DNA-binding CsgD family transcriptional regulator
MIATATLSKRENEVAKYMAWGATKKEVAQKLFISERTVENHARSIYEKTGCTKVNELSAWWFCKNFGISFDLSPIKRSLVSLALLIVILPSQIFKHNDIYRTFRSSRVECRTARRVRREIDTFEFDI